MNKKQLEILEKKLGIKLDYEQVSDFKKWEKLFLEFNMHTNLMSKNETENLFEKHIYDSLSVVLWKNFYNILNSKTEAKLLDIGTGGGFPGLILALAFKNLHVFANDSRKRKTKFLEIVKDELNLKNLTIITERAENIPCLNVDITTFRAVGKIKEIFPLAKRHTVKGGRVIFYKAKDVKDEIDGAFSTDKNLKSPEIIPYSLPIDVEHTRNLVIYTL